MSHFIIKCISVFIFGTPNGQANTQLLQAMQRGFFAVCTVPSSVRLIASAGQTSAQVGESQCMQTIGAVCGDTARSMKSSWIIEYPLWVSHSEQACTQALQPMHRLGSTKNSLDSTMGMVALGFAQACGAHLVFGNFRNRILGRNSQLIGALPPAPVIRNKDSVRANRTDHFDAKRGRTPS